ncbi:MAG: hypothetical protein IT365_23765 [Candidatus Hydrogenedentes bacterium]|nr:hypothetical protein [Candidatus Hydrogenedentota bacterium]
MSDLLPAIPLLLLFALWAWSVIWAMRDADRRGKPGCLVGLLVGLLSWPLGLLLWIVFRPEGNRRYY